MTLDQIRQKYPMNRRGFTVIPTVILTPETIQEWMIGLRVTMGLHEIGIPTEQGTIAKYDDKIIHVKVGTKTKKVPYPGDITLCVYQFDEKILFSNETVDRRPEEHKPREEEPSPPKKEVAEVPVEPSKGMRKGEVKPKPRTGKGKSGLELFGIKRG